MKFTPVQWSPNELIDTQSLNTLNDNMVWLRDRTPSFNVQSGTGATRTTGIGIASGWVKMPKNKNRDTVGKNVYFKGFFIPNSRPSITTGTVTMWGPKLTTTLGGAGRSGLPDHTGFFVRCNVLADVKKRDKFTGNVWVSWIAVGWKASHLQ